MSEMQEGKKTPIGGRSKIVGPTVNDIAKGLHETTEYNAPTWKGHKKNGPLIFEEVGDYKPEENQANYMEVLDENGKSFPQPESVVTSASYVILNKDNPTGENLIEVEHNQKFDFIDNLTFSKALEAIKRGHTLKRKNWEEGAVVFLTEDRKWIRLRTYTLFTYYYLNHEDILAEDWEIVE